MIDVAKQRKHWRLVAEKHRRELPAIESRAAEHEAGSAHHHGVAFARKQLEEAESALRALDGAS